MNQFKEVVDDVIEIDIDENYRKIEKYISSLKKYASETETADIFSNCALYSESKFSIRDMSNLKDLITATQKLIDNEEYVELINSYVSKNDLKKLLIGLIEKYNEEQENLLKLQWLNSLIDDIKRNLQTQSSQTSVEEIDLYKIAIDNMKVEKFIEIVNYLKQEREIYREDIGKFKIVGKTLKYTGASQLKNRSGKQWAFSTAFLKYDEPFAYLQELKNVSDSMPPTDYYKYFIDIEYQILNQYGYKVSGGERAEFNLLNEIKDALKHDILLIDEPESSFDNLFLKNEVNILIKELSQQIPVVLVTHNNTVGASIKPDYILYTKRDFGDTGIKYLLYSGYPTSKKLKNIYGAEIDNYLAIIECLEAGETSYNERRVDIYEILKN